MQTFFPISLMLGRLLVCAYYGRARYDSGLTGPSAIRNIADRIWPRTSLGAPVVWVHTSGPGDALAGAALCRELCRLMPTASFYVTCNTRHAESVLREKLRGLESPWELHWLPFDSGLVIGRLLRRLRPSVFIGMQGELWPVLFRALRRRGVPTVILRSDMFDWDTQREYPRAILPLYRDMLACVDLLSVRSAFYRPRVEKLGVEPSRIYVGGDYRVGQLRAGDGGKDAARYAGLFGVSERTPLVVLAGLREDEFKSLEYLFSSSFGEVSPRFLIAPVEKQVLDAHVARLRKNNVPFVLRTGLREVHGGLPQVIVLDTSGELADIYGAASAAVMGDTFPPMFSEGRNYWEALAKGTPVIVGPDFPHRDVISAFSDIGACRVARDAAAVKHELARILAAPQDRGFMMRRVAGVLREMPDAAQIDARAIMDFLRRRGISPR